MASINFSMNNLSVALSGVNGYMEVASYTNLDPVEYKFKVETRDQTLIYTFYSNKTVPTAIEGFRRTKTDETRISFLGAVMP